MVAACSTRRGGSGLRELGSGFGHRDHLEDFHAVLGRFLLSFLGRCDRYGWFIVRRLSKLLWMLLDGFHLCPITTTVAQTFFITQQIGFQNETANQITSLDTGMTPMFHMGRPRRGAGVKREANGTVKKCDYCGKANQDVQFCVGCGTPLPAASADEIERTAEGAPRHHARAF